MWMSVRRPFWGFLVLMSGVGVCQEQPAISSPWAPGVVDPKSGKLVAFYIELKDRDEPVTVDTEYGMLIIWRDKGEYFKTQDHRFYLFDHPGRRYLGTTDFDRFLCELEALPEGILLDWIDKCTVFLCEMDGWNGDRLRSAVEKRNLRYLGPLVSGLDPACVGQDVPVVELQEGIEPVGPIAHVHNLPAPGLVFGVVKIHRDDAVELAELLFSQVVLRDRHVDLAGTLRLNYPEFPDSCPRGQPEDVEAAIFVPILRVSPLGPVGIQPGMLLLEGVGDVLQEDQAQHHVLVLGGVHVGAERVGGLPELGLEA